VTAVSRDLAEATREDFSLTRPVEVIYNFVDTERFRRHAMPACFRARFAQPEERLVVHVSNMRPVKRVADVVRAFARIARAVPARLVVAGDGPDRLAAERLAYDLEVADRVTWAGSVAHVEQVLAGSHLFFLTSEVESFGLAALEALACAVPVVAYRVGGVPEVVEDGVTGRLVPAYDTEAMADAAITLLRDDEQLLQLQQDGRAQAVTRFGLDAGIRAYEAYYARLLAERA
jgi:L-malate glycosyltransferase